MSSLDRKKLAVSAFMDGKHRRETIFAVLAPGGSELPIKLCTFSTFYGFPVLKIKNATVHFV